MFFAGRGLVLKDSKGIHMNVTPQAARHRREDRKKYQSRHSRLRTVEQSEDPQRGPKPQRRKGVIALLASLAAVGLAVGVADTSWGADSAPVPAQPYTEIARDSYQRDVTDGFGTADLGGAYLTAMNAGVHAAVASGRATVSALAPGNSFHAGLPAVSAADVMTSLMLSVPDTAADRAGFYFAIDLRSQANGAMYRAKIKIAGNAIGLRLARVGPGVDQTLAAAPVAGSFSPGDTVILQAQVTGGMQPALAVRSWRDGTPPPDWQLTYADRNKTAITAAGSVGTWAFEGAAGAPTSFTQSELRAWSLSVASTSSNPATPDPTTPSASSSSSNSSSAPPSSSSSSSAPPTSSSSGPTTPPVQPPAGGDGSDGRGAAQIGSAAYVVPANAIVVSPGGNDSGKGTVGDPLKTVGAAVSKASSGQTIVLRGGTYHEAVSVPASEQRLTVQAYPKEAVWFDGTSDVSGWSKSGSAWVHSGWTAQFDHSPSFTKGQSGPNGWEFVGPQNPMAAWPDAVWIDGAQLTQVGSAGQVKAGTFFVDYAQHTLSVGSDPNGHDVRASDLGQAFNVLAKGVTLQGFGVRRYATSLPSLGTVRLLGGASSVRDLVVTENATQGISLREAGNVVDHVTANSNGMVGVHANLADDLAIRNSVLDSNNAQGFNAEPSAAGVKLTRCRNIAISNNEFARNKAVGLWFDMADVGFKIVNNTFRDNEIGSQLELADTGIVANNVFDGGKYGLYVYDAGNVKVFNNSFANNPVGSVFMSQDARRQSNPSDYNTMGDKRYPRGDQTDPWLLRNVDIANNLFQRSSSPGMFQVYALDKSTNIAADKMNLTISGNKFTHRDTSSQPTMVGWGGGDNKTVTKYEMPAALAAAKNSAWVNVQDGTTGSSQGKSSTSEDQVATPLPSDVGSAIGKPAGTKHIGPF